MPLLDNIPKPVLFGVGALVVALILFRRPRVAPGQPTGNLGATIASMQLAAATNIQALDITSRRDVALAGEYTSRAEIAEQSRLGREDLALRFFNERTAGKNSITSQTIAHETVRKGMDQDFALTNREYALREVEADRSFKLARIQQKYDYKLDAKYLPAMFKIQLEELAIERERNMQILALGNRRADIQEAQAFLGSGGVPGALNTAIGGNQQANGGGGGTTQALVGAATGAMTGAAIGCATTGWWTFGLGCAASIAAGAAAGGGGSMS